MRQLAHAKINLWLNVVGRRAPNGEKGGYHLIDSLVAFTDLADVVEIGPSVGLSLALDGPFASLLAGEPGDNLVLKAARLLAGHANVPARAALRLTKNIPVAAGLGGGSADAAAVLRALADLWHLAAPRRQIEELAALLGADVPVCLAGRTCCVSGVGERLAPAPSLPPCAVLLVNPGVALSTAEVFAARQGEFSRPRPLERPWSDLPGLIEALAARGNDLAAPAIALRPAIADVLSFLRNCQETRYASMSGSGATCFALFETRDAAHRAASTTPRGWWRHVGPLGSG